MVIPFEPPDKGSLTDDNELVGVVNMPGGEKVPLISTPGTGTLTPPTRMEYSLFGSKPLTLN